MTVSQHAAQREKCAMCGRPRVVKGFDLFRTAWSELPCVRPVDAALFMAAGHNALRRSGPGQQHALFRRNGTSGLSRSVGRLAWVRYSISALSNLVVRENFPLVRFAALSCLWQRCPVFLVADHHGPGHAGDLVG